MEHTGLLLRSIVAEGLIEMMKSRRQLWVIITLITIFVVGCSDYKPASATSGELHIEADESVVRVINIIADSFQQTYTQSKIRVKSVEAREAIVNFVNDSARVIVAARELNQEELDALKKYSIDYRAYKCAFDAVAVIGHKSNPQQELRLTELDSIFSGSLTRWGRRGKLIDVAIGGLNSSTNEVFKNKILKGREFTPTAMRFPSSDSLVKFVVTNPAAIGIVGVNWIQGRKDSVSIFSLGQPGVRADSTQEEGKFYSPHQAYIYKKYYPLWRNVYVYSREIGLVASGFIAYVNGIYGQQKFLNEGLVPATQPVRLVETTR
jgi:phosphate transport system substrate-binding protein